jgi:hypothetical protein
LTYNNFQVQNMQVGYRSRIIFTLWTVIALLVSLSPIPLTLWSLTPQGLEPAAWQQATPITIGMADPPALLEWKNSTVKITGDKGSWQSPAGWIVQQAEWTDLNHDNQPELTLLAKRPFEPWPVDRVLPYGGRIKNHQDAGGNSSHIILITWKKDHWGELWAGSALARPVRSFEAVDMNQDGRQELVVLEGSYEDSDPSNASSLAIWQWNGFGFNLVSRLERPVRTFIPVLSQQGTAMILLQ